MYNKIHVRKGRNSYKPRVVHQIWKYSVCKNVEIISYYSVVKWKQRHPLTRQLFRHHELLLLRWVCYHFVTIMFCYIISCTDTLPSNAAAHCSTTAYLWTRRHAYLVKLPIDISEIAARARKNCHKCWMGNTIKYLGIFVSLLLHLTQWKQLAMS